MTEDAPEPTDDPYALPGTGGVLRNRLGLDDWDSLEKAQAARSFQRAGQLVEEPIEGRFDLEHLQDVHHHLFRDVYDWAGELRAWNPSRVETVLGDVSVEYPRVDDPDPARRLDAHLDTAFAALADDDHLKGLETQPERFVERLATHMTAIWQAHAFRDGNTRSTSAFFRQIIVEAGYSVAHGFPSNPREFRDSLALAAHAGDARRLQAGLAAEIDAGPRLHALGDVGRDDPTPDEARTSSEALKARTAFEIDALRHGHYTVMKSIETRLDALRETLRDHLTGRDAAEAAGASEKVLFDERWKALDTAYYALAGEHAERTDAFEIEESRHALIARDLAERALPEDTLLARRGQDAAAFRDAMARWDMAEHRLEDAPADPAARRAVIAAVRRVRESPGNLVRLNDGQRAALVARYESLAPERAEATVGTALAGLGRSAPKRDPSVARTIVARERLAREAARQLAPAAAAHRDRLRALEPERDRAARAIEAHDARRGDHASSREETTRRSDLVHALDRAQATLQYRRDDFVHEAPQREGAARDVAALTLPEEASIVRRAEERAAFDTAVRQWREAERGLGADPESRQARDLLKTRADRLRDTPAFRARLDPEQRARLEGQMKAMARSRDRGLGR